MELLVNTFFEKRVEDLFALASRVEQAFDAAGLEYRVVGGLATYLYVEEREPDAGRLTKDIDIVVRREDLEAGGKISATEFARLVEFHRETYGGAEPPEPIVEWRDGWDRDRQDQAA